MLAGIQGNCDITIVGAERGPLKDDTGNGFMVALGYYIMKYLVKEDEVSLAAHPLLSLFFLSAIVPAKASNPEALLSLWTGLGARVSLRGHARQGVCRTRRDARAIASPRAVPGSDAPRLPTRCGAGGRPPGGRGHVSRRESREAGCGLDATRRAGNRVTTGSAG